MLILLAMVDDESDRDKFEHIYRRYQSAMFKVAHDILHDESLAEDAVHQAFLKIIKHLNKIDEVASNKTKAFIVTIIKNTAIDIYRYRQNHPVISMEELGSIPDDDAIAPDNMVINQEAYEALEQEILVMNPIYAEALMLRNVQGMNDKEIAQLLDISPGAVRFRLHMGRKLLAQRLEGEANHE